VSIKKIIALDVGQKRVGVAATDDLGYTAQPLTVIDRKPHGLFLERLKSLCQERGTELLVLGLPTRTNGRLGPEAQKVLSLASELRNKLNLDIKTFDERLTTAMAERLFNEAGVNWHKKRDNIDKTAATIILEGYLTSLNAKRTE
jgi:putative Holliday junction resolvase